MRLTSDTGLTTDPALSPDGRLVAYASDRAGDDNLDIWVKQVEGGDPLRLTSDTADEYEPSFSPDGNRIVFRSERDGGGLYTIPSLGGEPRLDRQGRSRAAILSGRRPPRVRDRGRRTERRGTRPTSLSCPSLGGAPQLQGARVHVGAARPVWSPDGTFILFATGVYRPGELGDCPFRSRLPGIADRVPLTEFKKTNGLADLIPYEWTSANRILFVAKSGDTSHLFEIGISPPSLTTREWRLDTSPTRLTSGTEQHERPSVALGGSGDRRPPFGVRQPGPKRAHLESRSGYQPATDGRQGPAIDSGEWFPDLPVHLQGRDEARLHIPRRV